MGKYLNKQPTSRGSSSIKRLMSWGRRPSPENYQPDNTDLPPLTDVAREIGLGAKAQYIVFLGPVAIDTVARVCSDFKVIVVGENLNDYSKLSTPPRIIRHNINNGLPHLPDDIVKNSVIVCYDLLHRLQNPRKLLRSLSIAAKKCPFLLISTPDRVRKNGVNLLADFQADSHEQRWTLDELANTLVDLGFQRFNAGYAPEAYFGVKSQALFIAGLHSAPSAVKDITSSEKVTAIVTAYNESDIIESVVLHLLNEGVDVHVIENWSNDGTFDAIESLAARHKELTYERYPEKKSAYNEWDKLLARVEEIAEERGGWILHYDSDEIRVSPWQGVGLKDAIRFVDQLGYNSIEFSVLDFRPTKEGFSRDDNPEEFFTHFEFGKRSGHFVQIKGWKQPANSRVDLASSGGHEAKFERRKTYPIKFINKHYSLRSTSQARKKIFTDRLPRYAPKDKARGWHKHYDSLDKDASFLFSKQNLIPFDPTYFSMEYLLERTRGINLVDRESH